MAAQACGGARSNGEAGQAGAAPEREKMAVRRQLQGLFQELCQDLQPSEAIAVERPPSPAAATGLSPPPMSPLRLPSSPSPPPMSLPPSPPPMSLPPSPPPLSPLPSPPRRRGPLPEACAMFQCRGCWAVLGDSLQLCAQGPRLDLLVCFKVTEEVVWEEALMVGLEGALLGCAYYALTCRSCGVVVGFILYSSGRDLAYLRGLFCLFKDSILCYFLEKQMIVEASKIIFPAVTLKEKVQKLKQKIVEVHFRIEALINKLEELKQRKDVARRQSLASSIVSFLPQYSAVRVNL